jgi:hypothetical protein
MKATDAAEAMLVHQKTEDELKSVNSEDAKEDDYSDDGGSSGHSAQEDD